jgi:hypothetical protein
VVPVTLLAGLAGRLLPLGGDDFLHVDAAGAGRVLGRAEAFAVERCASFEPIEVHQRALQEAGLGADAARELLARLRAQGLLQDFAGLLAAAIGSDGPPPPPRPRLVIRSWHRPAGVARLLASIRALEVRHDVAYDVVVVDDTDDAAFAARTRELVAVHAAAARGPVALLGPGERGRAIAALCAPLPARDHDGLRALLDPAVPSATTGSRSWNFAQLLAAGGSLSILDDDTFLPLRWPDDGDALFDPADASEAGIRFFDDDGHGVARELDAEPFEWLARHLARPAARLFAGGFREATLRGRPAAEFAYVSAGARTVGVVPGLHGALALDTSAYAVASNAYTMASLWRAPYDPARLDADRVWHTYPHPRITSHAVYTPLLLDAREPLPFAGTWGRVDDQYFLMLLHAIAAPIAFAHVPAMLGHSDFAPRDRRGNAQRALPVDPNLFLAHCFGRWGESLAGNDRWTRLAAIGAAAADWALASDARLGAAWVDFRRGMRARVVERTAAALEDPAAPPAWREVAGRLVRANREAIIADRAEAAELGTLRAGLRQAADAARLWPAVWQACAGDEAFRRGLAVRVPQG